MKVTPRRARWIGRIGSVALRTLGATWRVRRHGCDLDDWRVIGAFLHGDLLMMAHVFRGLGAAVMISRHGDGELIAQVTARMGQVPVRGSSTRGGAQAYLEMVRRWADRPWGITPDGPRGPRGSVHPGAIQLAADSGRMIHPLGFACSRGKRLSSWDRFTIPAPFARIVVHIGPPLHVPADIDGDARDALREQLRLGLADAEQQATAGLTQPPPRAPSWPPWPRHVTPP